MNKCVSCGGPAKGDFCEFCINEEINIMLPENLVCNLIARNADKFVTVSFIAKDGNERTYNGRFNVKKYYKGTAKSEVVSEMLRKQNLIPIWTQAEDGSYSKVKSFRPNTVTRIVAEGRQVFTL